MAARIRSTVNGVDPLDEQSRDVGVGDVVSVVAIDAATTYNWELSFIPQGSSAVFSGSSVDISPGSFTPDLEGPYLVRLTVDTGLVTETVQYVRIRVITSKLGLKLVAGGERRDPTGIIPIDIDIEGWANEQNANLQVLEQASTSALGSKSNYLLDVPVVANGTATLNGWVSDNSVLDSVSVRMGTVNTQGNYTLDITNVTTGNTCLSAPFDMNTLTNGVVSTVPLTSIDSDLDFSALQSWVATLTSDNVGFDGSNIILQLSFRVV